jgi:hypothetical protein
MYLVLAAMLSVAVPSPAKKVDCLSVELKLYQRNASNAGKPAKKQLLADPSLLALNGESAQFLSGGKLGDMTYGCQFRLRPTRQPDGRIRIDLTVTLSTRDKEKLEGLVPSLVSGDLIQTKRVQPGQKVRFTLIEEGDSRVWVEWSVK